MKKILGISIGLYIFLLAMQGDNTSRLLRKNTFDPREIAWENREIFQDGLIAAEQALLSHMDGTTIYHLDFEISQDFSRLQGHAEVLYTNMENTDLHEVYFRLFPNVRGGRMTIHSVQAQNMSAEPIYELNNSAMRVPLPLPLQPGDKIELVLDFEVEIPQTLEINGGFFGHIEHLLVLENVYPAIPVYDSGDWNIALPTPGIDFTCYDPSLYIVRITAPADVTLITSGTVIAHEKQDAAQIVNVIAGPARDFYLAAGEGLIQKSANIDNVHITSYGKLGEEDTIEFALNSAKQALNYFHDMFGPYPYTELEVLATPVEAMGMEYPGVIVISRLYYDLAGNFSGVPARAMLEGIVLHEVAHQWFYNVVGSNQPQEPWLDEALIQYLMGLFYRDSYGYGAYMGFRESWLGRWDRVERQKIPIGLPGERYQGKEAGAILYGRGPLFMEQLAEKLGLESFKHFLREYYAQHVWKIATGESFKTLLEEHCECDLTPLFEEWVYE